MGRKITAEYVREDDKKHSVRYRTESNTCPLKDMSVYVPRTVLGENVPHRIRLTLEIDE